MTQYSGKIIRKNPVVPTQQAASGVWTVTDAAAATKNNIWPVAGVPDPISRSVRLRSSASAYLNRTQGTPTDEKKFTQSVWLKRGTLGVYQAVIGGRDNSTGQTPLYFTSGDQIGWGESDGVSTYYSATTTAVFRDPSAWYHIVTVYDSNNATAADRLIIYVNGVRQTITISGSGSSIPSGRAGYWNQSGTSILIGATNTVSDYFDGYLTEMNNIDGQALTPSSFGTTDAFTGAWIPMAYTGTYGANGFYLNFKDNTSTTTLGYDYSGNSNNWAANNISLTAGVTYDSMLDVPTPWVGYNTGDTSAVTRGNYAVMNPVANFTGTLSNGNLKLVTTVAGNDKFTQCTMKLPTSGKWYWENTITISDSTDARNTQYITNAEPQTTGNGSIYMNIPCNAATIYSSGTVNSNLNAAMRTGGGGVLAFAYDADAGSLWVYKNGAVSTGGTANVTGLSNAAGDLAFAIKEGSGTISGTNELNFGQRPFSYTPPTGYKALCTTNLPDPTIKLGAQYFAASTYTGTGAAQSIVNSGNNTTGTTFQPDFIWFKSRAQAYSHALYDSVRGRSNALVTNSDAAEDGSATSTQDLTSFNSNGFSLGTVYFNSPNNSASNPVAWQWKAAGSSVSNTSGTITSTVNASTTAGFSVVTYTGTGANATVGHGLGAVPKFIIVKSRSVAGSNWPCYHVSTGNLGYNYLNLTLAVINNASYWNSTTPTSTVFSLGNDGANNQSSATFVAYCFSEVAGYSKFGSYTGNGSADGPFVYCGFRPRFFLWKPSSTTGSWAIYDSSRNTYNVEKDGLWPNLSSAEADFGSTYYVDFLSNGFKIRGSGTGFNGSGETIIFAAFAENPFKYSNAR